MKLTTDITDKNKMKKKSKISAAGGFARGEDNRKFIKIAFIGGGNMAEAFVRGILRAGIYKAENILVTDTNKKRLEYCRRELGVITSSDNPHACRAAVIVLAVKPQQAPQVLNEFRKKLPKNILLISIITGFAIKKITAALGQPARVIRVVPNTPALAGSSASAYCCGQGVSRNDRHLIEKILKSVGIAVYLDEPMLNAVTALSGSGPAYVFYFVEALLEAAREIGLPYKTARELVLATISGSALLLKETGSQPEDLRNRVTSRRGTTEAALKILDKGNIKRYLISAIKAAYRRARELSGEK